jgi:hypothetical protein
MRFCDILALSQEFCRHRLPDPDGIAERIQSAIQIEISGYYADSLLTSCCSYGILFNPGGTARARGSLTN